jgi:Lectin like domain
VIIASIPYGRIYHHDVHDWRDSLPKISKAFNAFSAASPDVITAVSFYTTRHNVHFTVRIFSRIDGHDLDGELASQNGSIEFAGLHTVDLKARVQLKAAERFYIFVEISAGGHAIDRTSEVPILLGQAKQVKSTRGPVVVSMASRGESFYHYGREWKDLFDYQFANPAWGTFDGTANFCMKALAARQ